MEFKSPNKRRIFYSYNENKFYRLFSFSQEKDGSIYCNWPGFLETKWLNLIHNEMGYAMKTTNTPDNSLKLSLHRSGVVKFKQNIKEFDTERIKGYHLVDFEKQEISPRHLFTSFMKEPHELPASPYGNRTSDTPIIRCNNKPFVIMFFAIPQQTIPMDIKFAPSFNIDLFDEDFQKDIGFGLFSLAYHDIFWFLYRTKLITQWPKHNHIFYTDGYHVPLFIPQEVDKINKIGKIKVVLQEPVYKLDGNKLSISISFPQP